jgi:hypothetical protein
MDIVHLAGRVGNQQLQLVGGFMIALATEILGAVDDRDIDASNLPGGHSFVFDSGLEFPRVYNLHIPMNAFRTESKLTAEGKTLSHLICSTWT